MILVTVTEFRNNLSKYLELAFREKVALKSKNGIIELNPSKEIRLNPSPSNDPWFDNSRNMEEFERGLAQLEDYHNGKSEAISYEDFSFTR